MLSPSWAFSIIYTVKTTVFLFKMYNKTLKISMKTKKYSMFSIQPVRYTVNINKSQKVKEGMYYEKKISIIDNGGSDGSFTGSMWF